MDEKIPLCLNNLLNKQKHEDLNIARILNNTSLLASRKHSWYSCRLLKYNVKRAVACLDVLNKKQELFENHFTNKPKEWHFVFMGDSRIRQQFFNFLRVRQIFLAKIVPSENFRGFREIWQISWSVSIFKNQIIGETRPSLGLGKMHPLFFFILWKKDCLFR